MSALSASSPLAVEHNCANNLGSVLYPSGQPILNVS